ncbi:Nop14-like protein [Tricholoma matsutake]|nr:Nop14-like protein [Tricholoma matsutake 945]
MVKGSQLTQLKSALSKAGVTGNKTQGKKRKRSSAVEKDKDKTAAKLQEIHQRLNPFDVKVTKLKYDIGGRKLKGVTGKPAQSKQAGIEQRKKTLLKEFQERDRAGGIVDRRFGENDPSMSLEERMLERFTRERQRASKGVAFNLEDEDELTHYGQSLSKLDDFDNVGLGLDDDEQEKDQIDADIVKKTHFGGFDDDEEDENVEPARKRSKAEVMSEVIAKSKMHKLLRQTEKEQEENLRHELDVDFDSLRDLIYAPDPSSTGANSIPLGHGLRSEPAAPQLTPEPQDVDYDQHVRELVYDKRAKPKDRTKTEEELALEEKEALEKAERRRRKRMLGLDESESEDEVISRRKRKRGGDDLEDDFEDTEWNGLGAGLGENVGVHSDEEGGKDGDAGENDDEEETSSGAESEGESNDVESVEDSEGEEGEHEDLVPIKPFKAKSQSQSVPGKDLPFTFPCPSSHEIFLELVEDVEDKDVPTVVHRIRTLYHTSLAPENKFKLQTLTAVLIDHILYITSPPTPRYTLLSSLLLHLNALTQAYPVKSAECFVEKLSLMYKNLKRGLSRGASDVEARTWPGLPELSLLRVIGSMWSTSDLNHAVISPTRVLMGAYLGLCRVRSLADIASGLFLCTLFLQFEALSKRLVPEAVNFLVNAVLHLAPHQYKEIASLPGSFPSPDFRSERCRLLTVSNKKRNVPVVRKADLGTLLSTGQSTEQAKTDLLGLSFDLLGRYAEMYKGLDGFIELYQPITEVLQHIDQKHIIDGLQTRLNTLIDMLERLLKFAHQGRKPLLLQAHKPIPIPSYIPKFEANASSYLRHQDPDHERNEAPSCGINTSKKGRQEKQRERDRAYNERMKRVFGSIEGERAEEKAMEREKSREKRRAGRK